MKIPYGLSNFKDVITEGYLYIDKTAYIEKLEQQGKFNLLLRPRRFGKSLFLSSLWYYYDSRFQNEFAATFGNLYIGNNPTPLKNSYQVLFLNSAVLPPMIQKPFTGNSAIRLKKVCLTFWNGITIGRKQEKRS